MGNNAVQEEKLEKVKCFPDVYLPIFLSHVVYLFDLESSHRDIYLSNFAFPYNI